MEEVKSADLRHRVGECVSRAARGETFLVIRYSEPIAVLRPRRPDDAFESLRDLKREASTTGHDDRVADLPGASAAPFSRRVKDEVR